MKVLPPGLEALSSHKFGSLFVQATDLRINKNQQLTHFNPIFFGSDYNENSNNTNILSQDNNSMQVMGSKVEYKVVTNLWLFFMYLSDMQKMDIQFYNINNQTSPCMARVEMSLKPAKQVMNQQFNNKNIFNVEQLGRQSVVDGKGNVIGSVIVKMWTEMDMGLHEQIKQLINFSEMVVFQGISPINSQNQLPRQPPQQISSILSQSHQVSQYKHKHNQIITRKEPFELLQSQIKQGEHLDEHKMMEQDIDKLIMEMQSKTYDSSRYQQSKPSQQHHKSSTQNHFYNRSASQNFNQSHKNSFYDSYNNWHNNSHKYQQTEASLKHIPSRPPTYSPLSRNKQELKRVNNKIVLTNSGSQRVIKGQNLAPRSHSQSFKKGSDSCIQLKIHEMQFSLSNAIAHTMFSQLIQSCYTLKIYLNNDLQQYFIGQGVKQGQIIKFNLSLKVRNVDSVEQLKFVVCDDYGKVQCEGAFDLSRLYTSNSQKGVFIISLTPITSQQLKTQLKIAQNKLVQVSPLVRTLRIQAQLIQRVEMVQLFIKISKVSLPFSILRYKIPLTKQTIEHGGANHINIFPHSCSQQVSDKIIVQFWKNQENIGQSQISLKNIRNVNINTLNANIDPIYIYDGRKQIRNILQADRMVGQFNLTLCFGTVKQMQGLLISAINEQKLTAKAQNSKVQVAIDQRLGIYVTKKPTQSNQVSIQVQLQQPSKHIDNNYNNYNNYSQKVQEQNNKFNQPSFGDQSIISHTSHNQFMDASIVSFAKNNTIEQPMFKIQEQPKKKLILPTITQKIGQAITHLLTPICQKLNKIKQLCKPHLLYNFIDVTVLTQILTKLDFQMKLINKIFKIAVFPKQNMININILYDLCASISIQGKIKQHLVNDQMLIVGSMRLLYHKQPMRKLLMLQNDMQFKQMAELYQKVDLKLTLHQYQTLQKFMSNYKTKKDAENLKQAVISELQQQTMEQLKQGFYEQDILKQIYGNQSSMSQLSDLNQSQQTIKQTKMARTEQQFKATVPIRSSQLSHKNSIQSAKFNIQQPNKSSQTVRQVARQKKQVKIKSPAKLAIQKCKILIDGVQNVIESAQCVFDQLPKNLYFRIIIDSPVFEELSFSISQRSKQFEASEQLKDADGRAQFMSDGKVLACAAFSLIRGVDSLYPMKTKDGHFCGLLKINLQ